jgi:hypothetical protein
VERHCYHLGGAHQIVMLHNGPVTKWIYVFLQRATHSPEVVLVAGVKMLSFSLTASRAARVFNPGCLFLRGPRKIFTRAASQRQGGRANLFSPLERKSTSAHFHFWVLKSVSFATPDSLSPQKVCFAAGNLHSI